MASFSFLTFRNCLYLKTVQPILWRVTLIEFLKKISEKIIPRILFLSREACLNSIIDISFSCQFLTCLHNLILYIVSDLPILFFVNLFFTFKRIFYLIFIY